MCVQFVALSLLYKQVWKFIQNRVCSESSKLLPLVLSLKVHLVSYLCSVCNKYLIYFAMKPENLFFVFSAFRKVYFVRMPEKNSAMLQIFVAFKFSLFKNIFVIKPENTCSMLCVQCVFRIVHLASKSFLFLVDFFGNALLLFVTTTAVQVLKPKMDHIIKKRCAWKSPINNFPS
jgi:hypothetical protein